MADTPDLGAAERGGLTHFPDFPAADLERLEEQIWQFEAAWQTFHPPRLEDLVAAVAPAERGFLLRELLLVEREYRERRGENPTPEEYAARFPNERQLIDEVFTASTHSRHRSPDSTRLAGPDFPVPPLPGLGLPSVPGFQILEVLGRGGMGVVYRASEEGLQRVVALKMVRAGTDATPEDLLRFQIEGETVARLQHPHIVQIFKIGQHEGRPFIALEFVPGGSLKQRLRKGPMPWRDAVVLMEQLARAVHHAHQQGVIHRDLKPANILLSEDGRPKITDFGLAKFLGEEKDLTRTGMIIGTLSYMAPEQAMGNPQRVGPLSDIYALGAILYELLGGQRPISDSQTTEAVVRLITEDAPSLVRLGRNVPRDLATICDRCREREPTRRYATAEALADDLRRFLEGEPIQARPVGRLERVVKWARRRPGVAGLVAAVVMVAILGSAGILWEWRDAVVARDQAARDATDALDARDDARRNEERARQALEQAESQLYLSHIAQARLQAFSGNSAAANLLLDQCPPARRGWEWRYLRAQLHGNLLTVQAHAKGMTSLEYSPDGRFLASAQDDLSLWDAETGRLVRTFPRQATGVQALAFSRPEGKYLAANYADGSTRVWDAATGTLVRTIPPHDARFISYGLAFLPGTSRLAIGSADMTVRVWDVLTGKETGPVFRHTSGVMSVAFSADGSRLASCGLDGTRIWDTVTGKQVGHLIYQAYAASFSPDGTMLAVLHGQVAKLWNAATGQELQTFGGHAGNIHRAVFSPDGWTVATAGTDGRVFLWNSRTGERQGSMVGHRGPLGGCSFHPGGRMLASGDQNFGEIKVWDLTRRQDFTRANHFDERIDPEPRDIVALAFQADHRGVVALRRGGQLQVRDALTEVLQSEHLLPVDRGYWYSSGTAALGASGRLVALLDNRQAPRIRIFDTATGRETMRASVSPLGAPKVALSKDGRRFAFSEEDERHGRRIAVHDAQSGRCLRTLAVGTCSIEGVLVASPTLSPDGKWLAAEEWGESTARFKTWDVDSGKERWSVTLGTNLAHATYSDDARYLVGVGQNGQLFVWDAAAGNPMHARPLPGLPGVRELAISPDNRLIAAHSGSRLRLLELRSGQEVMNFDSIFRHFSIENVYQPLLAWSGDGQRLAATDYYRTVLVFDTSDVETRPAKRRLREEAAARAFQWHVSRAQYCLERRRREPALHVHFRFLDAATPPDQPLRWERAYLYARLGEWSKVLSDCDGGPPEVLADRPNLLMLQACARLQTADRDGYHRHCARLLKAVPSMDRPGQASVLQMCLLAPDDTAPLVKLAAQLQAGQPANDPWANHLLGLAYLRAGKVAEAAGVLDQVARAHPNWNKRGLNDLALTIAQYRQGRTELGRTSLAQSEQALAFTGDAPPRWTWLEWLEARTLHAEAVPLRASAK
jgi:WD40 repeat protein